MKAPRHLTVAGRCGVGVNVYGRATNEMEVAVDLWHEAMDELGALEKESLARNDRIALLRIKALLSISQEVSKVWDVLQRVETAGWGSPESAE